MSELNHSLQNMGVMQYLLAVTFLCCYALALGGFLGAGARVGLAAVGVGSAFGFVVLTDVWVHGLLLIIFAVAGIGLFIGTAWVLKALVVSTQGIDEEGVIADVQATLIDTDLHAAESLAHEPLLGRGFLLADEHAAIDSARG
ncbi:MAG: hypothetical protein RLZZ618_4255 [Pseudomonadota bacterium]|jgi:hypothetical protein